ncbi:MAG TPA: hypothetical protein VL475_05785, partial [Planctomycetaceae bacterium]|nr:hypothetical protein [Planctomycetaceae bacterium]
MRQNFFRLSIVTAGLLLCGIRLPADDPPAKSPAAEVPPAPPALVSGVQELLEEGFKVGPRQLALAKKKLEAARNVSADNDPRLDYAYGLVLVRQSQNKAAAVQFEAAVNRKGPPYWPAWQALIWVQLIDRQYDKGLGRLDEFAKLIGRPGDGSDITEPQREAARWIGEVLEALDRTVAGKKFHDTIVEHDAAIREALGDELSGALDLGRDMVHERDLELTHQSGQAHEEAEKKLARRRQGQKGKLDSDLVDLDKEKESTAKSAEEWKKWLDEALGKADKQLGQLEKDYQFQQKRAESLQQLVIQVGREITALDLQLSLVNGQQQANASFQMQY